MECGTQTIWKPFKCCGKSSEFVANLLYQCIIHRSSGWSTQGFAWPLHLAVLVLFMLSWYHVGKWQVRVWYLGIVLPYSIGQICNEVCSCNSVMQSTSPYLGSMQILLIVKILPFERCMVLKYTSSPKLGYPSLHQKSMKESRGVVTIRKLTLEPRSIH